MAGDVFKLHCEASGYPEPSIRWTLNGDTLNATLNGHQHEFRNRAHTILAVHSAPSIDMLFECVAESEAGTVTKQFIVSTFSMLTVQVPDL
ncbi:hemicentin-1-like protein [Aphelenchoides avenae]|nr:hemicentin-1-like protein [Aphelenchus avenae]